MGIGGMKHRPISVWQMGVYLNPVTSHPSGSRSRGVRALVTAHEQLDHLTGRVDPRADGG